MGLKTVLLLPFDASLLDPDSAAQGDQMTNDEALPKALKWAGLAAHSLCVDQTVQQGKGAPKPCED